MSFLNFSKSRLTDLNSPRTSAKFLLALFNVFTRCLMVYIVQNHHVTAVIANNPSPTQNACSKLIMPTDTNIRLIIRNTVGTKRANRSQRSTCASILSIFTVFLLFLFIDYSLPFDNGGS